jgi:hypothetical protein
MPAMWRTMRRSRGARGLRISFLHIRLGAPLENGERWSRSEWGTKISRLRDSSQSGILQRESCPSMCMREESGTMKTCTRGTVIRAMVPMHA